MIKLLEFDLSLKTVLGFHHYVYQFVVVFVPLFDTTEITGAAFGVDDEWHNAVAQAFLEHQQSAHATVAVLEGEDLLEADVEVQDVIALDLGLLFIGSDQLCQTGMDFVRVQELSIPWTGCNGTVLAGAGRDE